MEKIKSAFLLVVCGFLLISNVGSFLTIKAADKKATESKDKDIIEQVEEDRVLKLKKELSLTLPETIDNPSYAITFVNPTPSKPVEITIDGKVYSKVKSPFLLPNLTFGEHTIIFKFTNKSGLIRVLTTEVLVVPRPPQFDESQKTQFNKDEQISISGTATPNSQVLLIVNSNKTYKVDVNLSGKWSVILKDVSPLDSKINIVAYTVKNGIISDNHTKLSLSIVEANNEDSATENVSTTDKIIAYLERFRGWAYTNMVLLKDVGLAVAVLIIVLILIKIKKRIDESKEEKTLAELLSKQIDKPDIVNIIKDLKDNNVIFKTTQKKKTVESSKTSSKKNIQGDHEVNPNATSTNTKMKHKSKKRVKKEKPSNKPKDKKGVPIKLNFGINKFKKKQEKNDAKNLKTSKKATKNKTKKSQQSTDSIQIETTKKVLTKKEFLKQFKKITKKSK